MKTVYLVRHATAVERESSQKDLERPLSEKGREESKKMAQRFKQITSAPEIWISSHAQRALETAYIFAEAFHIPEQKVIVEKKIYDESAGSRLLSILQTLEEPAKSCVLFGHEPTLSELAALLVSHYSAPLPKTGILGVIFPHTKWSYIEPAQGLIKAVLLPNNEKLAYEIKKKNFKAAFYEKNLELLQLLDEKIAADLKETVTKYSEKLTKKFFKRLKKGETNT